MPSVDVVIECPVYDSFRVQQVAGMFDVPLEEKVRESFHVELPGRDEAWQIGLIVGPSGSGKTTVARQYFGDEMYGDENHGDGPRPADRAVCDDLADHPAGRVGRHSEAKPLRHGDHRRVDADHLAARVDQRSARVARI